MIQLTDAVPADAPAIAGRQDLPPAGIRPRREPRDLRSAASPSVGWPGITSVAAEAAFRPVPRHAFARPGNSLADCYRGGVVRNKKDADGRKLYRRQTTSVTAAADGYED